MFLYLSQMHFIVSHDLCQTLSQIVATKMFFCLWWIIFLLRKNENQIHLFWILSKSAILVKSEKSIWTKTILGNRFRSLSVYCCSINHHVRDNPETFNHLFYRRPCPTCVCWSACCSSYTPSSGCRFSATSSWIPIRKSTGTTISKHLSRV